MTGYVPPAYSHNVSLDLYEQQPFDSVSSSVKRLLVARWVNRGKQPSELPRLGRGGQARFVKITQEDGFEVLQDLLMQADEQEEVARRQAREARIAQVRAERARTGRR